VLTVVKIGGGLAREGGDDALRALCAAIGELGTRHRLLVVPGGGELADAVRALDRRLGLGDEASHRMAILAMEQFGWVLSELIPGAVRSGGLATVDGVAVLLPAALLAGAPLPASWEVTSDSIAAWVAGEAGAQRLVLVKPVDGLYAEWPPAGPPLKRLSARQVAGGVDAYLAQVLTVETWVINGREPARLAELLDTGRTLGTVVTPWKRGGPAVQGFGRAAGGPPRG
jgi:5-(aminomethyl)-3-furanmethanol phosphate kinase